MVCHVYFFLPVALIKNPRSKKDLKKYLAYIKDGDRNFLCIFSELINTLRETSRALCQQSEKWGEEWPPTESRFRIQR